MDDIHVVVAPWQIVVFGLALASTIGGALFAAGKILGGQFEKRLEERFRGQDASRAETADLWRREFSDLKTTMRAEGDAWRKVERQLLELKADLPVAYVRRDDWVRNQAVIESKLDGLALRIQNAALRGDRGHE